MDIIPNDVTEMPEIHLDEDSVNFSLQEVETTHAGFISDLKDSRMCVDEFWLEIDDANGAFGSLLQADRVVEKIKINFANKATQVDIQKLKVRSRFSIWLGIHLERNRIWTTTEWLYCIFWSLSGRTF